MAIQFISGLSVTGNSEITGTLSVSSITADNSTYTGIMVWDGGVLKYRTKAQILNDIGATGNLGTVTSVTVQGSSGLSGSGTVTSSGTITLTNSDKGSSQAIYKNIATQSGTATANSNNDTLTITGTGGTTTSRSGDTITINSTDNNDNYYVTGLSFNTTNNGILTATRNGGLSSLTVDLDGRYVTSSGVTSIATSNGITGGTITATGTIQVDSTVVRTTGNQSIAGVKSFSGKIGADAGIDGLTNANGGITGSNYNITGVNQLNINDPGEGIVFQGTTNVSLFTVDDATDSILRINNASALDVNCKITDVVNPTSAQDAATKTYVDTAVAGVPQGTVTSVTTMIDGDAITISEGSTQTITTSGTFDLEFTGASTDYINGEGILTTFPTIPTVNNGTLNMGTSTGLDGSASFTANQSGTSTFTVSLDLTEITLSAGLDAGATSLSLDLSEFTDMTADMTSTDEFIVLDSGAERRKAAGEIGNSIFSNTANYITSASLPTVNNAAITIEAGTNLTTGGTFTTNQGIDETITINMATGGIGSGTYGST